MPKNNRHKTIILIAGAVVIALATLLFVNAMAISDFGQPGQGVLSGRSNMRLGLAFVLLTGLSLVLLVALFRTGGSAGSGRPSEKKTTGRKAGAVRGQAPEAAGGPAANASGEILSETAGELRRSVEVIEEELEEILEDEAPGDKERLHVLSDETDRIKKIIAGMEQLSRAKEISRASKKGTAADRAAAEGHHRRRRARRCRTRISPTPSNANQGSRCTADRECLSRIIGNITDNAARFIKDSGTVTVTARRR